MTTQPIVWTIAGSDPSGCAGIQADIKTFQALGVHGCSIVTAITAQSIQSHHSLHSATPDLLANQIKILQCDLPPKAIKIGMIGDINHINVIYDFIRNNDVNVVFDPVLISSSKQKLFIQDEKIYIDELKKLFPFIFLITPNIHEAELILNRKITSYDDVISASHEFISLGIKNVLLKGGHFDDHQFSQDYWTNGNKSFWLASPRFHIQSIRGTGCTLSSAIAACLAQNYSLEDALVISKMYINQSIRLANNVDAQTAILLHETWPENQIDLPYLSSVPIKQIPNKFPDILPDKIGLYPIIDSLNWIKKLSEINIQTMQLRIKQLHGEALENKIRQTIEFARQKNIKLFINDYWQLAIKYHAYGVHLGQEDLETADLEAIRLSGLRLGVSTHCYADVARAHAISPSYIACGPIFATTSKQMPFAPQGLEKLKRWRRTLQYPLVAIGGINETCFPEVVATQVDGIAMISALTKASDPLKTGKYFLHLINNM